MKEEEILPSNPRARAGVTQRSQSLGHNHNTVLIGLVLPRAYNKSRISPFYLFPVGLSVFRLSRCAFFPDGSDDRGSTR